MMDGFTIEQDERSVVVTITESGKLLKESVSEVQRKLGESGNLTAEE